MENFRVEFGIDGNESHVVELEVRKRNLDGIGQLIHPLALLEINLEIDETKYGIIQYQLDCPNQNIRFNHLALVIDTCLRYDVINITQKIIPTFF